MQTSIPARPVSGTFFEAAQMLRPRPKIRPMSAPCGEIRRSDGETPEDVCSNRSGTTTGRTLVKPRPYSSRTQYQVATSQVLGSPSRLNDNVSAGSHDGSSSLSSPISSMIDHANALLGPRSRRHQETPGGEKVHGTICRAKRVLKNMCQRRRQNSTAGSSQDPLCSDHVSASTDHLVSYEYDDETEESEASTISNDPPCVAPLRPMSNFMPDLTIDIPENGSSSSVVIDDSRIEYESGEYEADGHSETRRAITPCSSSNLAWVSEHNSSPSETPFCKTNEDDDVFFNPSETPQTHSSLLAYKLKLPEEREARSGYKSTLSTSLLDSPLETPSSSPKLRHTALQRTPGSHTSSLRSRFAILEPTPKFPSLDASMARTMDKTEIKKVVRLAPSLEEGLFADSLEVYEDNSIAAAAPIIRGVKPDIVDTRCSAVCEPTTNQGPADSSNTPAINGLDIQSVISHSVCVIQNTTVRATPCVATTVVATPTLVPEPLRTTLSESDSIGSIPTISMEVLESIVFSAAYGNAECQVLASDLYNEVQDALASGTEWDWGAREQHLFLKLHLVQELDSLVLSGLLQESVFEVIRGQMFPTLTTVVLEDRDVREYICRAVRTSRLDRNCAKEVLGLLICDESFAQYGPEEEIFLERQPFDSRGFVYNDCADIESYRCLDPTSDGTTGSVELQLQPQHQARPGWRSSFLSKVIQIFRPSHWEWKS